MIRDQNVTARRERRRVTMKRRLLQFKAAGGAELAFLHMFIFGDPPI
jgi:hypothetical protein